MPSTVVNIGDFSTGEKVKTEFTFKDFFDPVTIVQADKDETSTAIIMDKNTGVLYVRKERLKMRDYAIIEKEDIIA